MNVLQDFSVLDALGESVALVDAAGRITATNAAAAELLGTTADRMIGRLVTDPEWPVVREDGSLLPAHEHPAMEALRTGMPIENTVIGVERPGRTRLWLLVSARPSPGPAGGPEDRSCVLSGRDITEWRADRAKAAGLARFYAIRAATGRAIARIDDRLELLQAVCQAALTEGHLSMAWIGFTDPSGWLQPAAWAGVERGYLDQARVSVDPASAEGRGPSGRAVRTRMPQVSNDIATDPSMAPWRDDALARGYRSSAAFPISPDGVAVGAFSVYARDVGAFDDEEVALLAGVAEDVSFALEAQEAAAGERAARDKLKASEHRFRELLESAPDAMVIVNAGGDILLVNRQTEAMFGFDRAELIGRPVETVIPGHFRDAHRDHRSEFLRHPAARPMGTSLDLFALRRDGTEFPVEVSLSPLRTDEGVWISAAVRDITERKRSEAIVLAALQRERELTERLRDLDRMKSDFVSTVSHELRTPLTSIIGSIELLADAEHARLPPDQARVVDILARNSRRLHDLVEDLLQLNQIDAGGLALQLRPTALAEIVERVRDDVDPIARAKGVALHLELDPGLGTADVDGRQLGRAIENLLTNAIKFTPTGGTVALRAERDAGDVRLVVSDTGLGIPEEEQHRLFTRFFRSSVATSHAISGTGLGLVIVKGIVDAHGGTLGVTSALGRGTTVTVTLPAAGRPAVSRASRTTRRRARGRAPGSAGR